MTCAGCTRELTEGHVSLQSGLAVCLDCFLVVPPDVAYRESPAFRRFVEDALLDEIVANPANHDLAVARLTALRSLTETHPPTF